MRVRRQLQAAPPVAETVAAEEESIHLLVRLLLLARLVAIGLTAVGVSHIGRRGAVIGGLSASSLVSLAALWYWRRVGPMLRRHPAAAGADVALSCVLLPAVGLTSAFTFVLILTALLVGLLYDWRGQLLFASLLLLGYWDGLAYLVSEHREVVTFQLAAGTPILIPLATVGGAALRRVLERAAATDAALQRSLQLAATADERARLAREMHDSVTKTLHGIALSAAALADWCVRDASKVPAYARQLASAAEQGAAESRALIAGLRADLGDGALDLAVSARVQEWSRRAGVSARCRCEPDLDVDVTPRYELLQVLSEALANVERHAHAANVVIDLTATGSQPGGRATVTLAVRDDGRGFNVARDLESWRRDGHYGLLGMAERMARVEGELRCVQLPGGGIEVVAVVPQRQPPDANVEVAPAAEVLRDPLRWDSGALTTAVRRSR